MTYLVELFSGSQIARMHRDFPGDLVTLSQMAALQFLQKPHPADGRPVIAIHVEMVHQGS